MPLKLSGIEVFGQTFGVFPGSDFTFRICKTQRRADFFVWLYNRMGYTHQGSRLVFDSIELGV